MAFQPVFGKTFPNVFPTASSGDWWNLYGVIPKANCIAAYRAKGAASLAASYVNLTGNATYNAADGVAPTWDATNGWKAAGLSHLITGIVPASTWSAIVRFSNVTGAGWLFGSEKTATTRFEIMPRNATGPSVLYGHGSFLRVTPDLAGGVVGITPGQGWRNGAIDGGAITGWTGTTNIPIFLLANTADGTTPLVRLTGYIQALAIYNNDQSANMAALTTAINAL